MVEGEAWSGTVNPAGLAVSGEDMAAMTVVGTELGRMSVGSQRTAVVMEVAVARNRKAAFVVKQNVFAVAELEGLGVM